MIKCCKKCGSSSARSSMDMGILFLLAILFAPLVLIAPPTSRLMSKEPNTTP
jgi:hypothetical protein